MVASSLVIMVIIILVMAVFIMTVIEHIITIKPYPAKDGEDETNHETNNVEDKGSSAVPFHCYMITP